MDAAFVVGSSLLGHADILAREALIRESVEYRQHAEKWFALSELVGVRRDLDTLRGRFWTLGTLSKPGDVIIWAAEKNTRVAAVAVCRNLGCALKHARALLFTGRYVEVAFYGPHDDQISNWHKSYEGLANELAGRQGGLPGSVRELNCPASITTTDHVTWHCGKPRGHAGMHDCHGRNWS
jgi:hypothetical protein